MSSKISGFNGTQTPSVGAGRSVQRPQDAAGGATPVSSSDGDPQDVQITGAARQLATLEQVLRDLPAVNETRVAQISSSIEQGTYTVHPREIADRLIQLEQALGQLPDQAEPDPTDG